MAAVQATLGNPHRGAQINGPQPASHAPQTNVFRPTKVPPISPELEFRLWPEGYLVHSHQAQAPPVTHREEFQERLKPQHSRDARSHPPTQGAYALHSNDAPLQSEGVTMQWKAEQDRFGCSKAREGGLG